MVQTACPAVPRKRTTRPSSSTSRPADDSRKNRALPPAPTPARFGGPPSKTPLQQSPLGFHRAAPSQETETSELILGLRACLAVAAVRPRDIRAIAFSSSVNRRELEPLLRTAQAERISVTPLPDRKLEEWAQSSHHEGVVLEAAPRRFLAPHALALELVDRKGVAFALDRVRNAYNIGAITRSAAFFGIDALLLGAPAPHSGLDSLAVRVAEGGAEHVQFSRTTDLAETLRRFRAAGIGVVGAAGEAERDVGTFKPDRPTVVVIGNEREGLTERVRAHCDRVVAIRGNGSVESLNVAVAAGILMARFSRPVRGMTPG